MAVGQFEDDNPTTCIGWCVVTCCAIPALLCMAPASCCSFILNSVFSCNVEMSCFTSGTKKEFQTNAQGTYRTNRSIGSRRGRGGLAPWALANCASVLSWVPPPGVYLLRALRAPGRRPERAPTRRLLLRAMARWASVCPRLPPVLGGILRRREERPPSFCNLGPSHSLYDLHHLSWRREEQMWPVFWRQERAPVFYMGRLEKVYPLLGLHHMAHNRRRNSRSRREVFPWAFSGTTLQALGNVYSMAG